MDPMFSNSSHGILMSYTDHSVQRRLKSNAPNAISGQVIKVVALREWREHFLQAEIL